MLHKSPSYNACVLTTAAHRSIRNAIKTLRTAFAETYSWRVLVAGKHGRGGIPAGWLGSDNLGEAINKQPHGLSQDELFETVLELWRQGLISFATGLNRTECKVLSTDEIRNVLVEKFRPGKARTYLRLTSKGGRVWEAFAAPRWDDYISEGYVGGYPHCKDFGELICTNRELLRRYLKFGHISFYQIDPARMWWDKLEPWQVTNWKILPMAHRVRFVLPDGWWESDGPPPQFKEPPRWYRWD